LPQPSFSFSTKFETPLITIFIYDRRQSLERRLLQEKTMNKTIYRIASLIMALVMILGNAVNTKAAGRDYYVSPTGSDANPGTASAPFKTFTKANSVLKPGSTLYIYAGTYDQPLKITKSGTSTEWITIQPLGGKVLIDLLYKTAPGIDVRASYVAISKLVVRHSRGICVNLTGNYITVRELIVHHCGSHGIQTSNSSHIKILNNTVYSSVLSNSARALPGGWGSGIKVRLGTTVLIQGNKVYNNYGEGIGTRGANIAIRNNTVYDNYSVNIYTNSSNALIERNFVYCTPKSGFERGGLPATGIGMGEEYFARWGARLKNARIINNIVSFCRHGIRYSGAEAGVIGGGLKNAIIAYNTLYGSVNSAISIAYASSQSGSLIANNIFWQAQNRLATIDNPVGLSFHHNLWKVRPPAALRGPGDKLGEPRFAGTPDYTPESYRLSASSSAVGAAADTGIPHDFYARQRGPEFDMGAIQFSVNAVPSSTQELPSSTPIPSTPQLTSTPTALEPIVTPTSPLPAVENLPVEASPTATDEPTLQISQETIYDNKHSAFLDSEGWGEEVSKYAMDGSFARTSTNGSSVSLPFTGQSFSLIYKGGPSYRKMDVYIDDVLVATIDQRHAASTYKARWDYPGQLTRSQHTLKLVFVTTGSTTNGSVDAVIIR
jgi:hypothetical protein